MFLPNEQCVIHLVIVSFTHYDFIVLPEMWLHWSLLSQKRLKMLAHLIPKRPSCDSPTKKIWQTVNTSDPGPSNPQHMSTNGDWAWMSLRAGSKQLWQVFIISAVFSDLWPTYGESAPAHCAYHRASVSNIIADIWFQLKWLQNTFWQALNPIRNQKSSPSGTCTSSDSLGS